MHDSLLRLYAHMAWADEQILSALDVDDPRLDESIALYGHLVAAEFIWLSRILRRDTGAFGPWTVLPLAEAAKLAIANAAGYVDLIESAPNREDIVSYRTTKGDPMDTPLGDILLHVALHGRLPPRADRLAPAPPRDRRAPHRLHRLQPAVPFDRSPRLNPRDPSSPPPR